MVITNHTHRWVTVTTTNQITSRIPPPLPDSFRNHVVTNLFARLAGKNPTNDVWYIAHPRIEWATNSPWVPPWIGCIFDATYPEEIILTNEHHYIHPTFWLKDVPMVSAVSSIPSFRLLIQDGGQAYEPQATLITRRHVLRVQHGAYGIGAWFRFTDTNGVHYSRQAIDVQDFDWAGNPGTYPAADNRIYQLGEALPDSVVPVKFLPEDATSKAKYAGTTANIYFTQWKQFYIISPRGIEPMWDAPSIACGGNSGAATFYLVNNDLVLSPLWVYSVYQTNLAAINARNETTDELSVADLSGFTE